MRLLRRIGSLRGRTLKMAMDAGLLALAYALAFRLRLEVVGREDALRILGGLPLVVALKIVAFYSVGCYRSIWRYSSLRDLQDLVLGNAIGAAGVVVLAFLLPAELAPPRSVPFIDFALSLLLTGGMRVGVRMSHETSNFSSGKRHSLLAFLGGRRGRSAARRALIVGAGDTGEMIVREMLRSPKMDYHPVAFVDDNPTKLGQSIHGVRVLGDRRLIPDLVQRLGVREVLIAMPSARGRTVSELVHLCESTRANLKILPDLAQLPEGRVRLSDIRRVEVEDLLGREPAELDLHLISSYLRGKRILITGAGGSIGSELCRQILRFHPAEIHLMGRGENSIYEIHRELARSAGFTRLIQVIGDVTNKRKLEGAFAMYRPQMVFHAGTDKHVPLMEANPDEAVFNNLIGTKNVLEVAHAHNVERVVCISSAKAVNPTSVMGCCKRVAELLIRSPLYPDTVAVAVRFGNVLGSRGSVIPLFQKQIAEGGPVTVAHPDVKRNFMTISEAAGLVIQAGAMGRGGEIFVLDMGEPVRIWDLACNMIRLAGYEPGLDVEIRVVGLRPGEKIEEELLSSKETAEPTAHPTILRVCGDGMETLPLLAGVKYVTERAIRMDFEGIRAGLQALVPVYGAGEAIRPQARAAGDR